jgi:stage III sporulation protein AA
MCSYSLHSHQEEMRNGYITLMGGHRAGIGGTAVLAEGRVASVRDVTSLNLRVARDIRGAADVIVKQVFSGGVCGLLIAGAPASGKTTVLRDLARQLSGGKTGHYLKVAVVDERCELGAVYDGVPQNDLGPCCDLLSGYPKAEGIFTAVRTLSPRVIVCDEIGGEEEASGMLDGLNCGVKIIATAHASSLEELLRRRQIARLLDSGVFDKIVRLGAAESPGEIVEVVEVGELLAQNRGHGNDPSLFLAGGDLDGLSFVGKSVFD